MSNHPGLEIRPCIETSDARGHYVTSGHEIPDADAHFFGVYRINDEGLSDHVADFPTRAEAEAHAASMAEKAERIEEYEARREAKRERYAELASKHAAASANSMNAYHSIARMIPPGQPILVGHHSERRHRRDIARMDANIKAAIQHDETAEYYARKAKNYGKHGISSDDPAAIDKLREKLADMESDRQMAKAVNTHWRKHKSLEGCPGVDEKLAAALHRAMTMRGGSNPIPFKTYHFADISANIRRVKDRIAALEKNAQRGNIETEKNGYTYREDTAENRAMFFFPDKPDDDTRAALKRASFKWSPTRGAWIRQLSNSARYAAETIMKTLDATLAATAE